MGKSHRQPHPLICAKNNNKSAFYSLLPTLLHSRVSIFFDILVQLRESNRHKRIPIALTVSAVGFVGPLAELLGCRIFNNQTRGAALRKIRQG